MKTRLRILMKLMLILLLAVCFLILMKRDTRVFRMKQPEGEGITVEDAVILMQALKENAVLNETVSENLGKWLDQQKISYAEKEYEKLLYGDYIDLVRMLTDDHEFEMEEKYREDFYLLKEDWYDSYDRLIDLYGLKDRIKLTEISVLSGGDKIREEETGNTLEEDRILSADGKIYQCASDAFGECYFSVIRAYICGDVLLTVREKTKKEITLANVWILEAGENQIQFFVNGFEVFYAREQGEALMDPQRECVADLIFDSGRLTRLDSREEKMSGTLLRLSDRELELKDKGTFEIEESCKVYQLYEELREADLTELKVGYDFADYVMDDGKICAVLIVRKENMESIRVAIMNSNFQSLYHEWIQLTADCETELVYGSYEDRKSKRIPAGEEITVDLESDYLKGDRVELIPSAGSGKIKVTSIERNQGTPVYRGRMEIVKTTDGLLLINELLLEEYLYSVVPSEMPASYPAEALKAQAVCARTYAYRYLNHPGLPDIGAHVDDSVNYQVYNNIAENVNSTRAVKDTTGMLLYYGGETVNTYYYSTSCGFGTDAGIWGEENREKFPYLSSRHIAQADADDQESGTGDEIREQESAAQQMTQEENFRSYILSVKENDYEKEEPWYRWKYEVKELDTEKIAERTQESFHKIYDISVTKRREGGVADVLTLETDQGTFEVTGEYNIRYILNNGGSIVRQDGTEMETGKILPSAYFVIDVVKNKENVIGYTIFGGGYGHGVGMSQNAAKTMGNRGMDHEEILTFFYPDCSLKKIY